jgi:hypothetical protein
VWFRHKRGNQTLTLTFGGVKAAANSGHLPLTSCPFPAVCDGAYIEITSSGLDLNWHHSWFRCSPNEAHPFTSFSRKLVGEGAWDALRFVAVGTEIEETATLVLGWKSSYPQILRGEFVMYARRSCSRTEFSSEPFCNFELDQIPA